MTKRENMFRLPCEEFRNWSLWGIKVIDKSLMFLVMLFWFSYFLPSLNAGVEDRPYHPDKFMITKATPKINGNFDDPSWRNLPIIDEFVFYGSGWQLAMPKYKTLLRMTFDKKNLYIALRCMKPKVSKPIAISMERDKLVWGEEEIVEIFLGPNAKKVPYYQFAINAIGIQYDGCGWDGKWNGKWTAKVSIKPDYWDATFVFPASTLGAESIENGDMWYLKMFRTRREVTQNGVKKGVRTTLFYASGTHSGPFGKVVFGTYQFMRGKELSKLEKEVKTFGPDTIKNIRCEVGESVLNESLKLYPELRAQEIEKVILSDISFFKKYVGDKDDLDAREDKTLGQKINVLREQIRQYTNTLNRLHAAALTLAQSTSKKSLTYGITTLSLYERFFQEKPIKKMTNKISLHLAKGETGGAQVIVIPLGRTLKKVRISSPIFRMRDETFKDCTEILYVRYLDISEYQLADGLGVKSFPDPLIPYHPRTVKKDDILAFYIRITVPADVPAGDYAGRLIVAPEKDDKSSVEVNLHVYDFDASKSPDVTLPFAGFTLPFGFYTKYIKGPRGREQMIDEGSYLKTVRTFARHLVKYRMRQSVCNCVGHAPFFKARKDKTTGNWEVDTSLLEKVIEICFEEGMTRIFFSGAWWYREIPERLEACIRSMGEMINRRGWKGRIVYKFLDEPDDSKLPFFERFTNVAHEVGIPVTTAANNPKLFKELAKYLDLWIVSGINPTLKEMQQGKEIFSYFNHMCFDHPATQARGAYWAVWKYKMSGYSYWAHHTWWYGYPWTNLQSYSGLAEHFRCYPPELFPNRFTNKDDGVRGDADTFQLYSSLRLEATLAGLMDYTYIYLLHNLCEKLRKVGKEDIARQGETCITKWQDILLKENKDKLYLMEEGYIPYETAKSEIAQLIEKLNRKAVR